MKLTFSLEYITRWGEELRLQCEECEYKMNTADGRRWTVTISTEPQQPYCMTYRYAMYRDDKLVWTEWERMPHTLRVDPSMGEYHVDDLWRPIPDDLPLFSSAYMSQVVDGNQVTDSHSPSACTADNLLVLEMRTVFPHLRRGERLAVMTSVDGWQKPISTVSLGMHQWTCRMPLADGEFKYVVIKNTGDTDGDDAGEVEWETGPNRRLPQPNVTTGQLKMAAAGHPVTYIYNMPRPCLERTPWRVAGVVIPVFSLRSRSSWGVGDFGDLRRMVQWAASVGMHALQTLPVNDTTALGTYEDSYPYNAISMYALHPMYIDAGQLGVLKDAGEQRAMEQEAHALNSMSQVDYVAVNRLKNEFLRKMYAQDGARVMRTKSYKQWAEKSACWLRPYAVFCHLRDTYGTVDFTQWPELSQYDRQQVDTICEGKDKKAVAYYFYVQYMLHTQLLAVRDEAKRLGVILKGDIPIGISRNSVEAWTEPWLFHMDTSAGAPPDAFATDGQNWGFPTYNWEVMAEHGYEWWKNRFRHLAQYFNAYRIDHVLGFFRIWQIPAHAVSGLLGQFAPSLPLTAYEIRQYGFEFDYDTMTRPLINDYVLGNLFGVRAQMVKDKFLNRVAQDVYVMKDGYNTQAKLREAVTDDDALLTGLYRLVSNVLFIRDKQIPALVHPRIVAQNDLFYKSLREDQCAAFDRLYNDYYYRRHNDFWKNECMKKLPVLTQCTDMLVCAEDLGMVPACVPDVMEQLRILSLEIQTMPKQEGLEFGQLENNPVRSVATISTHDMPTMRGWWSEDHARAQHYWSNVLHHGGEAPREMPGWLADDIIWRHLSSPSMLCLLSLQDWLSSDESLRYPDPDFERVNVPANPRHYWRYRMHMTIEQLSECEEFGNRLKKTIESSGR